MTTDRVFAAFSEGGRQGLGISKIPQGGFCISAFILASDSARPGTVLMGRLNPEARWDHIGALDRERVEVHSKGWMLPSSHLIYGESPRDAGKRILQEQLGVEGLDLGDPEGFSEVYAPRRFPDRPTHWDLEFVFRVSLEASVAERGHPAWKELKFLDARSIDKADVARSHEDIVSRSF